MGNLFSKPLTQQVDASVLRGAELYERLLRSASHIVSLFFIPLLNSPFSLSNYARNRKARSSSYPCGDAEIATANVGLPRGDSCATFASATAMGGRYGQHARLAELAQPGLTRVQSNASRSSRATSMRAGAGGGNAPGFSTDNTYHSPYSLAGIKANRETIQRRRARAELAAAGLDVQQLARRNSARSPTPSSPATPSSPGAPLMTKRHSVPIRQAVLTPALEPTPRLGPVRRSSRRRNPL
ncbi:hypothetical protein A4X13_0g6066 [Tilletia indica]|uniref:Uncharacterized protein n=1 Tax=Tilletia indica TaxID=43049 RepID=A0A177TGU1_9BASI|nr:hypothetical protein A4X13_0g6066 [Tilletia indica]